jgi:glycosyltransferase involved in cell wall biosynthesis
VPSAALAPSGTAAGARPALCVLHVMECTIGGTRRHLVDAAREQRALGLDVHVAASSVRESGFEHDLAALEALGVGVLRLPMVREVRPLTDWRHARALERHVRALVPDVVHTHSSKAGALGRVAAARAGARAIVHTPHTFAFLFAAMFSPAKRRLFRAVERRLARRTDLVVAVSASEAETIAASGVVPRERLRVVPNGIDPAPYRAAPPADRAALGVPEQAPLLALVGLLNVAKGQDLALRALARPELQQVWMLIVGHGETRAALEDQARALGIAGRVRFLGWRGDVPELLKASDALVLPSRWEGLPYVVLEAFAAGLPVVAAAVDGARELVLDGQTGFTAAVGDERDLARAIGRLVALPAAERQALGRRGRERVAERYSARAMAAGLVAVYREALERRRGARA